MPTASAIKEMSDEVIRMNTSKTMFQWRTILDKFEASTKAQERVTKHLIDCYNLNRYWAEVVVTKYFV